MSCCLRPSWMVGWPVGLLLCVVLAGCGESPPVGSPAPDTDVDAAADAAPDAAPVARMQVQVGLASAAKRLCSGVFVAGVDEATLRAEELEDPALAAFDLRVERAANRVLGVGPDDMRVTVVHRPGLGCTLLGRFTEAQLRGQVDAARLTPPVLPDPQVDWPDGSRVRLPRRLPGLDLSAVGQAVDAAFADAEPGQQVRTRAVLVIWRGRIVAERYAAPFDATTPQLGWSMTKSVTSALTGMLVRDGVLDVLAPAAVPEWQADDDPRAEITLEQLLWMSSGLQFSEVYDGVSDVVRMLFVDGVSDMGGFTADKPLAHEPGSHWSYASGTTNLIARVQRQSFRSLHDYLDFPRRRLFNPLGMASAVLEPDESGTFVGSSYMYATPRDWARFALLYLRDGTWNGNRLLPPGWVDYSTTPAPAAAQGDYGAQFWLNRGPAGAPDQRPHANLPTEMVYMSGFEGQNVVLIPSRDLIVLRMGLTRSGPRPTWKLTESVLAAFGDAAP